MTHYICKGECEGVSNTPGFCGSAVCSLHKHDLVECNCEDGTHEEVLKKQENNQ